MLEDEHPELDELAREEFEDALVDGDVPFQRGTAQAALRHGNFRIVYFGVFASNIGTWMQNVVLGAYALKLTGSSAYVGLVFFAQLGPLLFLSTLGGLLADIVDRRRFLVGAQLAQLVFSFGLAGIALSTNPSHTLIVVAVFAVGIANALGAPGLNAILPTLVPREDLPGAVALASVQMNLSRVIGPIIGAGIYYALERGTGIRDQRAHLPLRGDRAALGEVSAADERPGGRARVRPAPVGCSHRPPRPADLAHPDHALLVLVLLARVRRPDAGDRGEELRHRTEELAVRGALCVLRPRVPRWAR